MASSRQVRELGSKLARGTRGSESSCQVRELDQPPPPPQRPPDNFKPGLRIGHAHGRIGTPTGAHGAQAGAADVQAGACGCA